MDDDRPETQRTGPKEVYMPRLVPSCLRTLPQRKWAYPTPLVHSQLLITDCWLLLLHSTLVDFQPRGKDWRSSRPFQFRIRPLPPTSVELLLRSLAMSIYRTSSTVAAWIFQLRLVQRITGNAPSAIRDRNGYRTPRGHVTITELMRHLSAQ